MLSRLVRVVELLGVNAVPVLGVFAGHWSWATALSVSWAENLSAAGLVAARLWLYRRWTAEPPRADGPILQTKPPGEFLGRLPSKDHARSPHRPVGARDGDSVSR